MNALALPQIRRGNSLGKFACLALPIAIGALATSAAYAGADTTFAPALQKFTYNLCSLYVPFRFGQRRICEMAQKWIAAMLAAAGLTAGSPALAQASDDNEAAVAEPNDGYRVDGTAGEFQLVTHGVWRSPEPAPQPGLGPRYPAATRTLAPREAKKTASTQPSFRRAAYLPHVYAAEAQYGLPTGLLDALIWTESRYNPLAVSGAGAAGLGQLMPGTARDLGVANRFDPRANLWAAARYLRQLLDKFGVVHLAVAAYNAGPGAVERAGGIPLNGETPSYVRNVLAFWGAR